MKNFLLLMMFAGCGVTAIAQTPQTQQRVLTEQMIQARKGVAPKALPDGLIRFRWTCVSRVPPSRTW